MNYLTLVKKKKILLLIANKILNLITLITKIVKKKKNYCPKSIIKTFLSIYSLQQFFTEMPFIYYFFFLNLYYYFFIYNIL